MSLRIGFREEGTQAMLADTTVQIVLAGQRFMTPNAAGGKPHAVAVQCHEDDRGASIHVLNPLEVLRYATGGDLAQDILTPDNRIAELEPGDVFGVQIRARGDYAGHLIIENMDFGFLNDEEA